MFLDVYEGEKFMFKVLMVLNGKFVFVDVEDWILLVLYICDVRGLIGIYVGCDIF